MSCAFDFRDNGNHCLSVEIGSFYQRSITRTGFDWTGYTIVMDIYEQDGETSKLQLVEVLSITLTGIYIEDPTSGKIVIQISAADSLTFNAGDYPYKIKITDPSSREFFWLHGDINFKKV